MKAWILAALLWPACAFAEPVSLNFREIPVIAFAEATYKAILGRDLMIAPNVLGMDQKVTVSVKAVDKAKLPKLLEEVLTPLGVRVRDADGLVRLERDPAALPGVSAPGAVPGVLPGVSGTVTAAPGTVTHGQAEETEFEVFRPQYRTAEYLNAAMRFAGVAGPQGGQGASSTPMDAVVLSGSEQRRERLRKLLAELDQRPAVVNVRAALVEYSSTTSDSLSLGAILSLLGGKVGISANASASATNTARIKTGSIDLVLGAMASDSRFRFRTQPSLRLVDGEHGKLQVGSDVPVLGNLTITQSGQQVQSTEYKPSGLVLSVLPRILRDRVQAKVVQEVSSFAKTSTSGIDSPTLNKRLIESVVDAEDGEIVILAGLDEDTQTDGRSGPFTWFPMSKGAEKRTTQLLVLLEFKRL